MFAFHSCCNIGRSTDGSVNLFLNCVQVCCGSRAGGDSGVLDWGCPRPGGCVCVSGLAWGLCLSVQAMSLCPGLMALVGQCPPSAGGCPCVWAVSLCLALGAVSVCPGCVPVSRQGAVSLCPWSGSIMPSAHLVPGPGVGRCQTC